MTEYIAQVPWHGWGRGFDEESAIRNAAMNANVDPNVEEPQPLILYEVPEGKDHRLKKNGDIEGPVDDWTHYEVDKQKFHEIGKLALETEIKSEELLVEGEEVDSAGDDSDELEAEQ
jgi:hypothetical protein